MNLTDSKKILPSLPKGFCDSGMEEIILRDNIVKIFSNTCFQFGFDPIETPSFENAKMLGDFLPDQEKPQSGVFLIPDQEETMALRYDLTAPLARYVAQNYDNLPKPFRRYQLGKVWRNEKPGPERFREFYQFDADTIGSSSVLADGEMCILLNTILKRLLFNKNEYRIKIGNRKILNAILQVTKIVETEDLLGKKFLTVVRAIDKMDRVGIKGVKDLLLKGRKDASGDFTAGAGLTIEQANTLLEFLDSSEQDSGEVLKKIQKLIGNNAIGIQGVEELQTISDQLSKFNILDETAFINMSVVRGLGYYTGPVFEAELLTQLTNKKGKKIQFGSIAGGGRYDNLLSRFKDQTIPATGFSLGVNRLCIAMKQIGKLKNSQNYGPVIVTCLDNSRLDEYQKMVYELRNENIRAELYFGQSESLKAQLKYADKRNAIIVIIAGEDEFKENKVTIKNFLLGNETMSKIKSNEEWRQDKSSQFLVDRVKLVEEVKKIIGQLQSKV